MNSSDRYARSQASTEGSGERHSVESGAQSEDRMCVLLFACSVDDAQQILKYRDRMDIAFLPSCEMKEVRREIARFKPRLVACSADSFLRVLSTQPANRKDSATNPSTGLASPGVTFRERKVLAMLAEGKSNDEIAKELLLSVRTVKRTLSGLFERLKATNRTELASLAARLHLLDNDE